MFYVTNTTMCIYIYIYVYIHICVYTYIYEYIHTYIYIHTDTCASFQGPHPGTEARLGPPPLHPAGEAGHVRY